jgi:hypothetical protein
MEYTSFLPDQNVDSRDLSRQVPLVNPRERHSKVIDRETSPR